jgi:sporulation protein YlmC with PRC-barrel domain
MVLASTAEQLKQYPEYTPETWKSMKDYKKDADDHKHDSDGRDKQDRDRKSTDPNRPSDPTNASDDDKRHENASKQSFHQRMSTDSITTDAYVNSYDVSRKGRIEGVVRKVERTRVGDAGEQVIVTVEGNDGTTRRVALGPSWYVNATPAAPMRGDKVVIDTYGMKDSSDQVVATQVRSDRHNLALRDAEGRPSWALNSVESGGRSYNRSYSRFILASDLDGKKIDCRGNECGKVEDVIIDRGSGSVAFLSIDPNENFLGIGDKKRLVPWSVATVNLDGTVHIDASKDMVLATMETPKDLHTLNSDAQVERISTAYNVDAPRFEPVKYVAADRDMHDSWAPNGTVLKAIEKDSTKTITGTVTGFTDVKFTNGVNNARAMKVRMEGNQNSEELVLIGPSWYMENQKVVCDSGDAVKMEVCRTNIDGKRYWMAKTIDCNENRVVILSGNNTPTWTQP